MSLTPHRDQPAIVQRLAQATFVASVLAMALVVLVVGYETFDSPLASSLAVATWFAAVGISALYQGVLVNRAVRRFEALRSVAVDIALLAVIIAVALAWRRNLLGLAVFVRQAVVLTRIYLATQAGQAQLIRLLAQPAKLLAVSFLSVIFLGTVFLTFPRSTTDGRGAGITDAIFTSTSATCVTGLAVLNTNSDALSDASRQSFSGFGQVVLLVLVQVGGLGIMTLSAAVVLLLGRQLGMRSEMLLQEVMEESSRRDLERSIRFIVTMTFVVEACGALILYFRFLPVVDDAGTAAAYAIFTSVSAYCNAGFALWSDSLTGVMTDHVVMWTIMGLITIGGLGFVVISALVERDNFSQHPGVTWRRWSVHVRLVLIMSFGLTFGGAIVYYYLEFHHSLAGLSRADRAMAALFQSVTLRTAGFNTTDFGSISRVGLVFMLVLMFIGGSSGSTAGGVKTSTVAVVVLSVRAMLLGRDDVEVGGRTIPKTVVYKAISILVIFAGLFMLGFLALLATEPDKSFEALLFETMSAMATVGVSTGITPALSTAGKLVVTFLMFVGRIGPLTLALAVGEASERTALRYPEGKIMVG